MAYRGLQGLGVSGFGVFGFRDLGFGGGKGGKGVWVLACLARPLRIRSYPNPPGTYYIGP